MEKIKAKTLDLKKFLKKHPVAWTKSPSYYNIMYANKLPMYKWIIIDSAKGIGINYAYRLKYNVVVISARTYSKDESYMSYSEYNKWRKEILKHKGS